MKPSGKHELWLSMEILIRREQQCAEAIQSVLRGRAWGLAWAMGLVLQSLKILYDMWSQTSIPLVFGSWSMSYGAGACIM